MKKIILLNAFIALSLGVRAQKPDPDTTARHFLIMTSIGNLQEISSGQLAIQKTNSANVKSFGAMMITDHGQTQQKLLALAKMKHISLPAEATTGIQADLKLKNATNKFDKLYVHNMVADHRNTVKMFETYAIIGKDPDVKAFAQQILPTLRAHLAAIMKIDDQLSKN